MLNLNSKEKDALTEAGNIGAAHAATALSNMLNETIMIDVTKSQIIGIEQLRCLLDNPMEIVAGVYMQVTGEGDNNMLMLFPKANALKLVDMFYKLEPGTYKEIDEKAESVLNEIANICGCAYLNALANLLDIVLFPTAPGLAVDMMQSVVQFPVLEMGTRLECIVIIETELIHDSDNFKGFFLFMPDQGVQDAIMSKFKIQR